MDFALVAPLVIGLCLAVVQIGMWVVSLAGAHRVAFAAARQAAATHSNDDHRVQVAREFLRRELPAGIYASARVGRERVGTQGGSGDGDVVIVELGVPLRLWDWPTPVRGSVSALVPVEPG